MGGKVPFLSPFLHVFLTTRLMMRVGGFDFPWLVPPCVSHMFVGGGSVHITWSTTMCPFRRLIPTKFGCFQKLGVPYPKMDGENHEKPFKKMDDFGGSFPIFGNTPKCAAKDSATPVGWKNMGQSSNSKELPDWPRSWRLLGGGGGCRLPLLQGRGSHRVKLYT